GPRVQEFEAAFARYLGAAHAVAVNSCTAALHLALAALGLKRGQGVVVPTLTFAATAEVVTYFDARPVFVDVEPETLCMDPAAVESALARGSKRATDIVGAIPVHYGGQMAAMPRLARILRAAHCFVVEDAAHALPSALRDPETGRWIGVGALADVACFSFYANKTITTGEGGMATTEDGARARAIRSLAWHLYPIRLRLDHLTMSRGEFIHALAARGVATSVHWRPLHMQPYYAERYGFRAEEFPVAFREWRRLISLPIFPGMSDADVDHTIAAVRDTAAEARKRRVAVA